MALITTQGGIAARRRLVASDVLFRTRHVDPTTITFKLCIQ